jgi:hypothetical protein
MNRLLPLGLAAVALSLLSTGAAFAADEKKAAPSGAVVYVGPMEVGNRGFFSLTSSSMRNAHMKGIFGPMGPGGVSHHGMMGHGGKHHGEKHHGKMEKK